MDEITDDMFEVETISDHHYDQKTGNVFYKVKWKDYDESHNTFEPQENLSTCCDIIEEYWRSKGYDTTPSFPLQLISVAETKTLTESFEPPSQTVTETVKEEITASDIPKDTNGTKEAVSQPLSIEVVAIKSEPNLPQPPMNISQEKPDSESKSPSDTKLKEGVEKNFWERLYVDNDIDIPSTDLYTNLFLKTQNYRIMIKEGRERKPVERFTVIPESKQKKKSGQASKNINPKRSKSKSEDDGLSPSSVTSDSAMDTLPAISPITCDASTSFSFETNSIGINTEDELAPPSAKKSLTIAVGTSDYEFPGVPTKEFRSASTDTIELFRHIVVQQKVEKFSPTYLFKLICRGNCRAACDIIYASPEEFDFDVPDQDGNTFLIEAARGNHAEVIRALLTRSIDLNRRQNNGKTALIAAAETGNLDACALLIEAGAHVNKIMFSGESALMKVCKIGQQSIVELLLEYGADTSLKSESGFTASQYARRSNHHAIVKVIDDHSLWIQKNIEDKIQEYLGDAHELCGSPLFPIHCQPLRESTDVNYTVDISHTNVIPPPGAGWLLFFCHCQIDTRIPIIHCRLHGPCFVHQVKLNSNPLIAAIPGSNFVLSFLPKFGKNHIRMQLCRAPVSQTKIVVVAYKVKIRAPVVPSVVPSIQKPMFNQTVPLKADA